MTIHDRRTGLVIACLTAVAGYVDAVGFITTGGYFVSFMSGNTTRLGIGLAQASIGAAVAAGLAGAFVAGVVAGALVARMAGRRRAAAVLALVAILLAASAALHGIGLCAGVAIVLAFAMGTENTVFAQNGEVRVGVTYTTGTLVSMGNRIAAALTGSGARLAWLPHLFLWTALFGGAAMGAAAHARYGARALWGAAAAVALLALATVTCCRSEPAASRSG